VIDFAQDIPEKEITLIATKAMLAARDGLHPALVDLLVDAAREIHGAQGFFERAGEFPGTDQVDLRVSADAVSAPAIRTNLLHRYLPFWVATIAERAIIILVPLAALLLPLFHYLPQFLRWRVRSRIYRWYGELAMLERDVATRDGTLPPTNGCPTSTASSAPYAESGRPRDSPAKPIRCASTSASFVARSWRRSPCRDARPDQRNENPQPMLSPKATRPAPKATRPAPKATRPAESRTLH
jgi:hypothetical protein